MFYKDKTDIQIAKRIRMLKYYDPDHEAACCDASDRIRDLSQQLEKKKAIKERSVYEIIDLVLTDVKIVYEEPVVKKSGQGYEVPKYAFVAQNATETAEKLKALLEQTDV